MNRKYYLIGFLLLLTLILPYTVGATVTQSANSIQEGEGGVSTEVGTFTIQLNSTEGANSIYVNLSLYKSTTLVTYSYLTAKSNGTQSLTIPSLDGNTNYQIRINANDTSGYNNQTYNFTTRNKKLTDQTENFGSAEILLLGLIILVIIIGFIISMAYDIKNSKSMDVNKLVQKLVIVIIFVVVLIILAGLI